MTGPLLTLTQQSIDAAYSSAIDKLFATLAETVTDPAAGPDAAQVKRFTDQINNLAAAYSAAHDGARPLFDERGFFIKPKAAKT